MAFIFKDWFFRQYPDDTQNNDVNKNELGEGTWQRYLRIYGLELDEEFVPYITNFLDIVDIQKTDDKYLPAISSILGSPPGFNNDNAIYRKILAYAIAIYKVKGTKRAYEIFLNLLGIDATIIEVTPRKKVTYDMPGITYDAQPTNWTYDSFCENCSGFYLALTNANNVPVDQATKDKLNNILCFLQPINASFKGFMQKTKFEEVLIPNVTETQPF